MHELSTVIRLVNLANEEAKRADAKKVNKIVVSIGEMTGVLPEYVRKYYPEAVAGTLLEGSELEIIEVPVKAECQDCKTTYHPEKSNDYKCPKCGSLVAKLIEGRKTNLESIEVD